MYYEYKNSGDQETFYYPIRKDEKLIDVLTSKKIFMNGFLVVICVCPNSQKYCQYFIEKKIILKRNNNYTNLLKYVLIFFNLFYFRHLCLL